MKKIVFVSILIVLSTFPFFSSYADWTCSFTSNEEGEQVGNTITIRWPNGKRYYYTAEIITVGATKKTASLTCKDFDSYHGEIELIDLHCLGFKKALNLALTFNHGFITVSAYSKILNLELENVPCYEVNR